MVVVACVCVYGGAGETSVEGWKRGNLGRFALRGKVQPAGSLAKQLSRQGRERGNLGRLDPRGKVQSAGVHTKQLSRQGRGGTRERRGLRVHEVCSWGQARPAHGPICPYSRNWLGPSSRLKPPGSMPPCTRPLHTRPCSHTERNTERTGQSVCHTAY